MTTTSISELAPCPFCGEEAVCDDYSTSYRPDAPPLWYVGCSNDDCHVQIDRATPDRDRAIAAWNTRSIPTDAAAPEGGEELGCNCPDDGRDGHHELCFRATPTTTTQGEVVQADIERAKIAVENLWDCDFTTQAHYEGWLAEVLRDHRLAFSHPSGEVERLREALEQAEETLDQILDDMSGEGQCVCLAVKNEAIDTLAQVRAALSTPDTVKGDRV